MKSFFKLITSSLLPGTDPNRNWGHHWGGVGASTNPCDETYRGKNKFSEVETTAVKNYLTNESKLQSFKVMTSVYRQTMLILTGGAEIKKTQKRSVFLHVIYLFILNPLQNGN